MKLLTPSSEKRLYMRVRNAHAKLVRSLVNSDLAEVAFAVGAMSGVDPREKGKSTPTPWTIRSMIKSGSFVPDVESVADVQDKLTIASKAVRDRLLNKARIAIRDGSASLRRQKLSGKREIGKARSVAAKAATACIEKAIQEAHGEWKVAVDVAIHEAMEDGRAQEIVKSFGRAARVWKKLQPDACRWCKALHTIDGVVPRVFTIDELAQNGSNAGRRGGRPILKGENATEWLPVIGSVHPRCKCAIFVIPPGMGFNARGVLVRKADGRRTG